MAKYSDAIRWMAENDDTDWLGDQDSSPSVTACLTADLFHKDDATVRADLEKYMQQRIGADLRASLTAGDGRP